MSTSKIEDLQRQWGDLRRECFKHLSQKHTQLLYDAACDLMEIEDKIESLTRRLEFEDKLPCSVTPIWKHKNATNKEFQF